MNDNELPTMASIPKVQTINNQHYIVCFGKKYWIDDLSEITRKCVEEALKASGSITTPNELAAVIDEAIECAPKADPIYIDPKKWEPL